MGPSRLLQLWEWDEHPVGEGQGLQPHPGWEGFPLGKGWQAVVDGVYKISECWVLVENFHLWGLMKFIVK